MCYLGNEFLREFLRIDIFGGTCEEISDIFKQNPRRILEVIPGELSEEIHRNLSYKIPREASGEIHEEMVGWKNALEKFQ